MTHGSSVERADAQYPVEALDQAIVGALESSDKSLDALTIVTIVDPAPVDHFHMGGLEATVTSLRLTVTSGRFRAARRHP